MSSMNNRTFALLENACREDSDGAAMNFFAAARRSMRKEGLSLFDLNPKFKETGNETAGHHVTIACLRRTISGLEEAFAEQQQIAAEYRGQIERVASLNMLLTQQVERLHTDNVYLRDALSDVVAQEDCAADDEEFEDADEIDEDDAEEIDAVAEVEVAPVVGDAPAPAKPIAALLCPEPIIVERSMSFADFASRAIERLGTDKGWRNHVHEQLGLPGYRFPRWEARGSVPADVAERLGELKAVDTVKVSWTNAMRGMVERLSAQKVSQEDIAAKVRASFGIPVTRKHVNNALGKWRMAAAA